MCPINSIASKYIYIVITIIVGIYIALLNMSDLRDEQRLVICIGDIHGYYSKLKNLWRNLKIQTNPSQFDKSLIIFLGDYCDKGPETNKVIEFLIDLPTKYPNQKHVFLLGNHDFGFSAFLGLLPPPCDGSEFKDGWKEIGVCNEENEGWYRGEGYENMHFHGRRWGGMKLNKEGTATQYKGSVYNAAPTFESYQVPHGSAGMNLTYGSFFFNHLIFFAKFNTIYIIAKDVIRW